MRNFETRLKKLEAQATGPHVCEVVRIRPDDGQEELLHSFLTTKPHRRIVVRYTDHWRASDG